MTNDATQQNEASWLRARLAEVSGERDALKSELYAMSATLFRIGSPTIEAWSADADPTDPDGPEAAAVHTHWFHTEHERLAYMTHACPEFDGLGKPPRDAREWAEFLIDEASARADRDALAGITITEPLDDSPIQF